MTTEWSQIYHHSISRRRTLTRVELSMQQGIWRQLYYQAQRRWASLDPRCGNQTLKRSQKPKSYFVTVNKTQKICEHYLRFMRPQSLNHVHEQPASPVCTPQELHTEVPRWRPVVMLPKGITELPPVVAEQKPEGKQVKDLVHVEKPQLAKVAHEPKSDKAPRHSTHTRKALGRFKAKWANSNIIYCCVMKWHNGKTIW